jgi:enoyl-CoA hydratase
MTDEVLYEAFPEERLAIIRLNRPDARNAVNPALSAALETAIDRLEADDDVWVGILTGNGPAFCAGADLKTVAAGGVSVDTERGGFAGFVRRERDKPVIAAVDGPAVAGGSEIALACDLIVATTASTFGLPEVKRSLVASAGGLSRLPRALPPMIAMELALTGEPMDAATAAHHGLVNRLVAPGTAVDEARALAAAIVANAPLAVRATRRVLLASRLLTDEEAMRRSGEELRAVARTEDFREGPRAFVEKRPPVWRGR